MMTRIDKLNCLLILCAFLVAWASPFALLVFSYALLGPLHYLTEIVWLEERQCFLPKKRDSHWLVGLAVIGTLAGWLTMWFFRSEVATQSAWAYHTQQVAITTALLAVALPLILWTFSDSLRRILSTSVVAAIGTGIYYLYDAYGYFLLFAVLLPTVVHVYVFTGLFLLSGALSSRSLWGGVSCTLLLFGGLGFLLIDLPQWLNVDEWYNSAYMNTVGHVHHLLIDGLQGGTSSRATTSDGEISDVGMRVSRFLAFAYTYHYLNWFSKTTVIGWHKCERSKRWKVIGLWIVCVLTYFVNYSVGLTLVGLLSLLHVFYELPLNWRSFHKIACFVGAFGYGSKCPPTKKPSLRSLSLVESD